jgi:DNA-binding transcriptional MerR regulator
MKADELDIVEVARRSGLPASTLRFYEQKGLISSSGRSGLRRVFKTSVLEQLDFIALGRWGRLSLEEIAAMLAPEGRYRVNRRALLAKADALGREIETLAAVRRALRHVARCPEPRHGDCPKFRRLLRDAGRRARSRPR